MILVIRRNLQVTAFTWLVDCTMDSFIEAVANPLRIHGDDFHVCSSQFQWFDELTMSGSILNRYAPFITEISPFQAFQSFNRYASFKSFQANAGSRRSKFQGSRQFKGSTFNDHILSGSSRFSTARQGQTPTFLNDLSLDALFLKDSD